MREPNFLPEWYPKARRQKQFFNAQLAVTAGLLLCAAVVLLVGRSELATARTTLASNTTDLSKSKKQLQQLDELLRLRTELTSRQKVISEIGLPVDVTRLISELAACMPPAMSLTEFHVDLAELNQPLRLDVARGRKPSSVHQRILQVQMTVFTPLDTEITQFMSKLSQRPFIDDCRLIRLFDSTSKGRAGWSSELSIRIPLSYNVKQETRK